MFMNQKIAVGAMNTLIACKNATATTLCYVTVIYGYVLYL